MAVLIRTDGTARNVTPREGRSFSLEEIKALIGCQWIECVYLGHTGLVLVVDEEGKLGGPDDKPPNRMATDAVGRFLWPGDFIAGHALLASRRELGEDEDELPEVVNYPRNN